MSARLKLKKIHNLLNGALKLAEESDHQLMLNKEMSWVQCYIKSEADKVIAEKDFLIKMMRKHIYKLKLADAIEKMNFWVSQKFWWESLKDKVTTEPLFDYDEKAKTWMQRVEKYKSKIKELKEANK